MTQWWRVKPPLDSEFLVLVAGGRVVTSTPSEERRERPSRLPSRKYDYTTVGDRWDETRKSLEERQFTCTMETL